MLDKAKPPRTMGMCPVPVLLPNGTVQRGYVAQAVRQSCICQDYKGEKYHIQASISTADKSAMPWACFRVCNMEGVSVLSGEGVCLCICTIQAVPALPPKGGCMRTLLGYLVVLLSTLNWHT